MTKDPYKYFRVEARELLEQLGEATLALEKSDGPELVQRLLRFAHTLKGAARVVKQNAIADAAHAIEEALDPYRNHEGRVPREAVDAILSSQDEIAAHVRALSPEEQTGAVPLPTSSAEESLRLVRAEVAEVDALLDGLRETYVQLGMLRKAARDIEHAGRLSELLAGQLTGGGKHAIRSAASAAEGTLSLLEELRTTFGSLERGMGTAIEQIDRELGQVRDAAEHLRLVRASTLFTSLERAARDTAQSLGKQVLFEGHGGNVRIDAHVLGIVQTALVQIIRNAVAHGIEPDTERYAAKKSPTGRVTVEILRKDRRVVFRCADDGRGLDVDAVRHAATRRGLPASEVAQLGSEELVRLLLRGGLSTAQTITEHSGRGIGLDIVREASERLGGELNVRTERGSGTSIELTVPLSLASVEGLAVESSGVAATIPLDTVRRTVRLTPSDVSRGAQGHAIIHEGKIIPFVPLGHALRLDSPSPLRASSAVIVESSGRLAAVGVDRLLGTTNVVLRPLPALTPTEPIVTGASLDAEGNPQLVLDAEGIIAAAVSKTNLPVETEVARRTVLVVDDSLTTRMLEQSILESAGYAVDVATSGEEGLEAARNKAYVLFLVDVEMPGIDGFTFVERVRADPLLRDVPAILVTSRSAVEDRARGARVGAQGYIVKSEFNQSELLARIAQLIGER